MSVIAPHRRPRYAPTERLAILELRAARGWSLQQTANAFLLTPATVTSWSQRIDEGGPKALLLLRKPVNRFPDFVRYAAQRLKTLCPTMGKVKIAQTLARAGLHLSPTTVGRMLKEPSLSVANQEEMMSIGRVVTAKGPNHVWHLDLTIVPTVSGFWASWVPFALPQSWPFCWWVAVAIDHCSRRLMSLAVFPNKPDSRTACAFLERVIRCAGSRPKYLVCDKDKIFWCKTFKDWCRREGIKPRYGAVGGARQHFRVYPANRLPRLEPRKQWPRRSRCAKPRTLVAGRPGDRFSLEVHYLEGRRHLPVVTLGRAA